MLTLNTFRQIAESGSVKWRKSARGKLSYLFIVFSRETDFGAGIVCTFKFESTSAFDELSISKLEVTDWVRV